MSIRKAGQRTASLSTMGLFGEDFDLAAAGVIEPDTLEPEIIRPNFTAADVEAARREGWEEGHQAGRNESAGRQEMAIREAISAVGASLQAMRVEVAEVTDQQATLIAEAMLTSLAAMFPELCKRHGATEVQAIAREILPTLSKEPAITVRVSAEAAPLIAAEIARLDPALAGVIRLNAAEDFAPSDVKISWQNGAARRDEQSLQNAICAALDQVGLVSTKLKETVNVG